MQRVNDEETAALRLGHSTRVAGHAQHTSGNSVSELMWKLCEWKPGLCSFSGESQAGRSENVFS